MGSLDDWHPIHSLTFSWQKKNPCSAICNNIIFKIIFWPYGRALARDRGSDTMACVSKSRQRFMRKAKRSAQRWWQIVVPPIIYIHQNASLRKKGQWRGFCTESAHPSLPIMTKVKIQILRGRNTLYQRGTFDKREEKKLLFFYFDFAL